MITYFFAGVCLGFSFGFFLAALLASGKMREQEQKQPRLMRIECDITTVDGMPVSVRLGMDQEAETILRTNENPWSRLP